MIVASKKRADGVTCATISGHNGATTEWQQDIQAMVVANVTAVDQDLDLAALTQRLGRLVTPQMGSLLPALSHAIDGGHAHAHILRLLEIAKSGSIPVTGYFHPNGFLKLRLASQPGRWTLRLHIWNHRGAEAQVHSHQWNFASRLLSGGMRTRIYAAPPDPDGEWMRLACRRTKAHGYEFRPIGRCSLIRQRETEFRHGDSYLQDHRWLHTLETSGAISLVTIVLQGHDVTRWSDVVAKGGEAQPRKVPVRALERAEIEEALSRASTLLSG